MQCLNTLALTFLLFLGDFQFAISSDDNSELWLSSDECPANARLLVFVGKLGSEWTAPGEFTKFRSQVSKPVHLISSRRYYFEILHKQDEKGSDHVEVGWRLSLPGLKFEVIDSVYISLYTDETSLKMNSVDHIPQSLASHRRSRYLVSRRQQHGADMLKPDPRDAFFLTPLIEPQRVKNVLPPCIYSPSYVVKDFPIARYQGLQFVYLSYVYPNDFTRLTHMETENKCFYKESPIYLEKFGFYKYMKMDEKEEEEEEEDDQKTFLFAKPDFLEVEEGIDTDSEPEPTENQLKRDTANSSSTSQQQVLKPRKYVAPLTVDYGDDVDDYTFRDKKRAFTEKTKPPSSQQYSKSSDANPKEVTKTTPESRRDAENGVDLSKPDVVRGKSLSWIRTGPEELRRRATNQPAVPKWGKTVLLSSQPQSLLPVFSTKARENLYSSPRAPVLKRREKLLKGVKKAQRKIYITRPRLDKGKLKLQNHSKEVFPGMFLYRYGKKTRLSDLSSKTQSKRFVSAAKLKNAGLLVGNKLKRSISSRGTQPNQTAKALKRQNGKRAKGRWEALHKREEPSTKDKAETSTLAPSVELFSKEVTERTALMSEKDSVTPNSLASTFANEARVTSYLRMSEITESQPEEEEKEQHLEQEADEGEVSDYSYEDAELQPGWLEDSINWQRTFSVSAVDFELLRSDWNDLRCNVSGNLQLSESEVVDVVAQYMEKLNEKNSGIYTLLRIINVEKRRDSARGNRFLIELELSDRGRKTVRLSEYVYLLLPRSKHDQGLEVTGSPEKQTTPWNTPYAKPLLCQPIGMKWKHDVMVHFIVPVKNQARWVQQFITDMQSLYQKTGDENFSIIIVDFESEDMEVEQALHRARLPRYQYLRRTGNFERSAGLQVGSDSIEDNHSILFLCDLHIHFPLNVLDNIRKHCVEGKMAYAPIVMRLGCGSSSTEPNGYWEVNGFGLFGIYKSDFDKIGGMNTEEFRDQWGGEDWELLDRVLQNGLEVERLRLRNFYHYYHSKRGMWNSPMKKMPKG
nr:PREDICTED: N-acetyl-beta-glucosaminyl-glycoprotein 4-beta-N-acetylgalactosaminyltransferase 1 isoform X1 [Latimeria chalumnae]|eukprot:XP_014343922.1 PREDICTED: N-acetyl-beta-glucosaminyl-glycoprotein 4-beta-N-acetylgalactosaminyltransferase 1 isoform X1 [Latimeria chalumnae]